MSLVSGRPISFRMDLYNPLFINRPLVEPELFASLRPPTYSGVMFKSGDKKEEITRLMKEYKRLMSENKFQEAANVAMMARNIDPNDPVAQAAVQISSMATRQDQWGVAELEKEKVLFSGIDNTKNAGGKLVGRGYLSDDEKNERLQHATKFAAQLGERMEAGRAVPSVATASALGDYFQYVIDMPVNLGRQKSALLPIINKDVDASRVSIYNPGVQAKHPLLGLKFKNTTGSNLSQGPITVFEGSTYAGDTRVLDLQPGEERLVSYAIDLGAEVSVKNGNNTARITKVKATKGVIFTETLIREEKIYDISNRTTSDRTLLIEHPNRKGQGFVFKGDNKPVEEAAEVFRFQVAVPSKKDLSYTVIEERTQGASVTLTNNNDDRIRYFLSLNETSPALKARLSEAMSMKAKWDDVRGEITKINARIQTISQDQNRIRQNLREVPKESEAYKRYLEKFDVQEKEMDSLHAKLKDFQEQEHKTRVAYENFLSNITLD
jgi:hypothetical protein